ncbi:MAG: Rrf2 family transcriptional regulator [Acidobacteriota bacterium]|nr:Rrf2 family transcriptional regulator [Acidobacteriota bacterium]
MQLTRFSDISLRLLLYLASRRDSSSPAVTARQVAEIFQVPYTHLVKVVHLLGQHGLIHTARGKHGGLRLAADPASTRIGAVLRLTEPGGTVIDCYTQPCPLRHDCRLKHALDQAYGAFFEAMDRYTLAELATMPALRTLVTLTA